jgi:hypothetical protein
MIIVCCHGPKINVLNVNAGHLSKQINEC